MGVLCPAATILCIDLEGWEEDGRVTDIGWSSVSTSRVWSDRTFTSRHPSRELQNYIWRLWGKVVKYWSDKIDLRWQ